MTVLSLTLLLVVCVNAQIEDSLQCNGTGMLMFEGDGRFSIVRDGGSGSLLCNGEVSLATSSPLYTRIISDGRFSCSSSSSVRLCGYGETELIRSNETSSMLQCNGEPLFPRIVTTRCGGNGNFTVSGAGNYTITADPLICNGDLAMRMPTSQQSYVVTGNFTCSGAGPYTIVGTGILQYVSSNSGNCTASTTTEPPTPTTEPPTEIPVSPTMPTSPPTPSEKFCIGVGNFSLVGDGEFNISQSPNVLCFGDVTVFPNSHVTTSGPFSCEGTENFVFYGVGLLYEVMASAINNCSSLIDNSPMVPSNDSVSTYCTGDIPTLFAGNGLFRVMVNASLPNSGLRCDGTVNEVFALDSDTVFTQTFGAFRCVSSGPVSINGTGVVDPRNDDLTCSILPIDVENAVQCSGTGTFEIIGSGVFNIIGIPEIACFGDGDSFSVDSGEQYVSRGSFMCSGSALFFVSGTGELESVTTERGTHNCSTSPTTGPTVVSGSGIGSGMTVDMLICTGEGDYVIVGDGDFFINQTGPGTLRCTGDVDFPTDEPEGMYFTSGEFRCTVSGIMYLSGMGTANVINASAPYQCNGVLFPGPTVEPPPFSGFNGDEVACFADGDYVIVGNGRIQIIGLSPTPVRCDGEIIFSDTDSNVVVLVDDFNCTGNGFVQITGMGEVFVNSTRYNNCSGTSVVVDDTPISCSGSGDYQLSGVANATIGSLESDAFTCSGQVAILPSSGSVILYYLGGFYSCNGSGIFVINGTGSVSINVTEGSYSCDGPQPILCATFNINENGGISVVGDGEFTIIGDDSLYCEGNAVLCPGEINYYFTDGRFYCTGDLFAHIDGVGVIENITGNNNCSGLGFAVPPPIFSGTPLTPQPVCIGYSNQYYLDGEGTFNISRIIGTISCNLDVQEVNSDILTYSSYVQPFNCSGAGIFFLEGIGASTIVNNDGFFNCIDLTPLEPLVCVGEGFSQVEGIGSFAIASLNASCRNRNTNTVANNLYINGSVGNVFTCQFNNRFELSGTGVIFDNNLLGRSFQCNTSQQLCEASGNFTFNATGNLYIRIRTGGNIMCTDEFSNSLTFESGTIDNIRYMFMEIDGSVTCRGNGFLSINGTGIIFSRMSDEIFACNAELITTTTTVATATTTIVANTTQTIAVTATVAQTVNTVPVVTATPTLATVVTVATNPTVDTAPTIATISTVITTPTFTMIPVATTTTTTTTIPTPTAVLATTTTTTIPTPTTVLATTTTPAATTVTSTTTSVSSATTTSVTASVTPVETVSGNW